jgi:hypothetical protein
LVKWKDVPGERADPLIDRIGDYLKPVVSHASVVIEEYEIISARDLCRPLRDRSGPSGRSFLMSRI